MEKETTAVPVKHTFEADQVPMRDQEKQGGKCCGGCCDYRRAVIVLAIISLAFSALATFQDPVATEDCQALDEVIKDHNSTALIMFVVGVVLTLINLFGAIIFNFYMVAIYVLWSIIELIVSIITTKAFLGDILDTLNECSTTGEMTQETIDDAEDQINQILIGAYVVLTVFTALWVYPSVFLAVEIKKGIMTKETYPREVASCCCVSK